TAYIDATTQKVCEGKVQLLEAPAGTQPVQGAAERGDETRVRVGIASDFVVARSSGRGETREARGALRVLARGLGGEGALGKVLAEVQREGVLFEEARVVELALARGVEGDVLRRGVGLRHAPGFGAEQPLAAFEQLLALARGNEP